VAELQVLALTEVWPAASVLTAKLTLLPGTAVAPALVVTVELLLVALRADVMPSPVSACAAEDSAANAVLICR
jgi:cysteine sulfinate desulfinase/cysteine desulfurase-like protein